MQNASSVVGLVIWEKNVGPDGNTNPLRAPQSLHAPQVSKLWKDARGLVVKMRVIERASREKPMEASRE